MTSPMGVTTLGAWVDALDPRPPVTLHERLRTLLAPAAHRPVADVAQVCTETGVRLLGEMLATEATGRADALDLLAVDALMTYAFEAAADDSSQIESLASDAMVRIGSLPLGADTPMGAHRSGAG